MKKRRLPPTVSNVPCGTCQGCGGPGWFIIYPRPPDLPESRDLCVSGLLCEPCYEKRRPELEALRDDLDERIKRRLERPTLAKTHPRATDARRPRRAVRS